MLAERKTSPCYLHFNADLAGSLLDPCSFKSTAYRTTTSRGQLSCFVMVVILTAYIYYLLIDKGISPHNVESVGNKRI